MCVMDAEIRVYRISPNQRIPDLKNNLGLNRFKNLPEVTFLSEVLTFCHLNQVTGCAFLEINCYQLVGVQEWCNIACPERR